jgi:predicted small secreted protein
LPPNRAAFNTAKTSETGEVQMRGSFTGIVLTLALLSGATIMLSGCNTTAGLGQDVSAAGHAVTNTADKVKSGM